LRLRCSPRRMVCVRCGNRFPNRPSRANSRQALPVVGSQNHKSPCVREVGVGSSLFQQSPNSDSGVAFVSLNCELIIGFCQMHSHATELPMRIIIYRSRNGHTSIARVLLAMEADHPSFDHDFDLGKSRSEFVGCLTKDWNCGVAE